MNLTRHFINTVLALSCVLWIAADAKTGITVVHVTLAVLAVPALLGLLYNSFGLLEYPTTQPLVILVEISTPVGLLNLINFLVTLGLVGSSGILVVFITYFSVSDVGMMSLCFFVALNFVKYCVMYFLILKHNNLKEKIEAFEKPYCKLQHPGHPDKYYN